MRRIARRQESDFLQAQGLLQLEGGTQMRVMNRVEGAAEDAHGIHGATLPETLDACKAPARPAANPVTAVLASPGASPLRILSVLLACTSNRSNGILPRRDSARGEGLLARFQRLPGMFERRRP